MTKGRRTQKAILDAMFSLMRRGIIAPTYTQIGNTMQPMATRATVCKHIQDMVARGVLTADVFQGKIVERTIRIAPPENCGRGWVINNLTCYNDSGRGGTWIMPWGVFLAYDEVDDLGALSVLPSRSGKNYIEQEGADMREAAAMIAQIAKRQPRSAS